MRRSIGKLFFFVLFGLVFLFSSYSQNNAVLAGSVSLYGTGSAPPVVLDSRKGWILLNAVNWEELILSPAPDGYSRSWRLRSSYEHEATGVPITLQVRLRGSAGDPTFTHPWSEGSNRQTESYSNWFKESILAENRGRGFLEARLIAPPRTPLSGKLFDITLEAWDSPDSAELAPSRKTTSSVQLAYAAPLPNARMDTPPPRNHNDGPDAALAFSLSFVENCLIGNLPEYYRSFADPVRILDDGSALAKYRLSPPKGIPGIQDIDSYKQRFGYKVYPVEEFRELFPEWFDENREWVPDENSYLFMGHQDRIEGAFPEGVDYLVFLTAPNENGEWKVVARPRN